MLTPSVNVVQSSFPEEHQGEISGLSRSVSNLGSSLGTAVAGTILVAGPHRPVVRPRDDRPGRRRGHRTGEPRCSSPPILWSKLSTVDHAGLAVEISPGDTHSSDERKRRRPRLLERVSGRVVDDPGRGDRGALRVIQWATGRRRPGRHRGRARPPRARAGRLLGAQRRQGRARRRRARRRATRSASPRRPTSTRCSPSTPTASSTARSSPTRRSSTASSRRARTSSRRSAGSTRPTDERDALRRRVPRRRRHAARHRHPPRRHHRAVPADGLGAVGRRSRHVRAEEFSDIRTYGAPDVVRDWMLFGKTPEEARTSIMADALGAGFRQSVCMVADELGFDLDPELRTTHEIAVATAPIDSPIGADRAGHVAAQRFRWEGAGRRRAGRHRGGQLAHGRGAPRPAVDASGPSGERFEVEVTGDPGGLVDVPRSSTPTRIEAGLDRNPRHRRHRHALRERGALRVRRASPGSRTYLDLPLVAGRAAPASARPAR